MHTTRWQKETLLCMFNWVEADAFGLLTVMTYIYFCSIIETFSVTATSILNFMSAAGKVWKLAAFPCYYWDTHHWKGGLEKRLGSGDTMFWLLCFPNNWSGGPIFLIDFCVKPNWLLMTFNPLCTPWKLFWWLAFVHVEGNHAANFQFQDQTIYLIAKFVHVTWPFHVIAEYQ